MAYRIVAERRDETVRMDRSSMLVAVAKAGSGPAKGGRSPSSSATKTKSRRLTRAGFPSSDEGPAGLAGPAARIERNREPRPTLFLRAGFVEQGHAVALSNHRRRRMRGTSDDEISYATGWTISGLVTLGTIVTVWLLGI